VEHVSVFRLRLGVVLIGIFWIPIWLLAPLVARLLDESTGSVTITIALIQTVIGLIGVLIAGRPTLNLVRHTKMRAVPGKIWRVVWTGKLDEPAGG
jgi:hypothetical protein